MSDDYISHTKHFLVHVCVFSRILRITRFLFYILHTVNVGAAGYDYGGVVTNNRHEQEYSVKPKRLDFKEPHW